MNTFGAPFHRLWSAILNKILEKLFTIRPLNREGLEGPKKVAYGRNLWFRRPILAEGGGALLLLLPYNKVPLEQFWQKIQNCLTIVFPDGVNNPIKTDTLEKCPENKNY